MLNTNSSGIIIRHKVVFLTPYRDSIFSEGDSSEIELPEQEPTGAALAVVRRRRGSGAEAMATPKWVARSTRSLVVAVAQPERHGGGDEPRPEPLMLVPVLVVQSLKNPLH